MSCCGSGDDDDNNDNRKIRGEHATEGKNCTDILWFIIFVLFIIVMIVIAVFSLIYGNPLRVINGYDSFGNTCGVSKNEKYSNISLSGMATTEKKYVLYFDVKHPRKSLKVCVNKCPAQTINTLEELQQYYKTTGNNLCTYNFDLNNLPRDKDKVNNYLGPCPALPIYESIPILHRCFPKPAKNVVEDVLANFYSIVNSWEIIEQTLTDLYSSWKELIIFSFVALGLSLMIVFVLHCLAAIVSWILMVLVSISSVLGTILLWYTYYEIKNGLRDIPQNMILIESLRNETAFLWYSIIATIITVILLLLVFFIRSQVSFLAALFKETAQCLGSIPGLFIQPLITFFVLMLYFIFWLAVIVCLATANHPGKNKEGKPSASTTFDLSVLSSNNSAEEIKAYVDNVIDFVDDSWIKGMWWVYFIGLIWVSEFILACQQMTIAGAVSHWYFKGSNGSSTPVLFSINKLLKYHIGSVAKGSFLITLFKIPRLIMTYLYAKLKTQSDKGSESAKCCLKCGICCFYCLEKFIRYLNHNAYTIIAIESVHFCKAAGIAFNTLVSNALQMATINSIGDFILFLGKCIVTAITGSLGLIMLKRNKELHFYAAPTLVICIFSFFIAHCILSLYEMVVDTLFICVCEDRSLNGSEGRWNQSGLSSFGTEPAAKKNKVSNTDAQPGTEMQALKSGEGDSK